VRLPPIPIVSCSVAPLRITEDSMLCRRCCGLQGHRHWHHLFHHRGNHCKSRPCPGCCHKWCHHFSHRGERYPRLCADHGASAGGIQSGTSAIDADGGGCRAVCEGYILARGKDQQHRGMLEKDPFGGSLIAIDHRANCACKRRAPKKSPPAFTGGPVYLPVCRATLTPGCGPGSWSRSTCPCCSPCRRRSRRHSN